MNKTFLISILSLAITWMADEAIAQTPPMCTVFDTLRNQNGVAMSGAKVTVSNVIKSGGELYSLGPKTYTSNSVGVVSFSLPRSAQANIETYFGQFNVPGGRQVLIPDAASVLLRQLQPGSISVSTNAGPVTIREIDRSPSYPITGNNDTLEVSNTALSNPSANVFRITIPTAFDDLSDVNLTGAASGDIVVRRASGVWVDTTLAAVGGGDITAVTAGIGLSGGGSSGDVMLDFAAIELGNLIFGDGSAGSFVWDFNLTAGDPQLTIGNDIFNLSAGQLQEAGNNVVASGDAAGGDLGGTYPSPSVTDDSHAHTSSTISGLAAADFADGDHGDFSYTTNVATIDAGVVSNSKLANMPSATIKMRVSGGSGSPEDIDISSNISLVTAVAGDFVIIEDATDGTIKRANVSDFIDKQFTFNFSFLDTVLVGDSLMIGQKPFAFTIDSIWSATNTGTVTIFFDYRAHNTPRTRGTNIETNGIVADAFELSTAFDDATIPAGAPIFCRVTSVASNPKQLWVTIFARKD